MALVHSSYAVSLSLTALAVLVLGVAAWLRRRQARGGAALAWLCLAATAWAACAAGRLVAGAGPAGTVWLELQRASEVLVPLALLAYALRATRLLARGADAALWALAGLSAVLVALAFGPSGGLSLFRALEPGMLLGHNVMVAVPSAWNVAGSALAAAMVAAALVLLTLALQAAAPGVAASQGWTLLGVAMPVAAEVVAALVPHGAAGAAGAAGTAVSGLAAGAFLLAPAALATAQGLLGGSRYLAQEGEEEPPPAAGTAPRQLLDHLDQPVVLVGASDTVSYANAAAGRLFHPPEGLPGARIAALFGDLPELAAGLASRRRSVLEIELFRGSVANPYEVWLTPLFEPSGRYSGTLLAFVDIAARRMAEAESGAAAAELGRSQALMEALQDALRGALRGESLGMLLDIVLTGAAGSLAVPHAALYLYDASTDALHRRVAVGGFESVEEPPQRRDEGLAGRVWASGRPLAVEALPNWPAPASEASEPWAGTAVAVPVRERGRAVGVLLVARRRGDWRAFTAGEIGALERFADLAAVAVHHAAARERSEHSDLELAWLDRLDALIREEAPDTEVLDVALRAARESAGFDRVVVWLASDDDAELEARAWLGFQQGPESGERWPLDGSAPLLEEVYRTGEEIVLADGGPIPARYRPSGQAAGSPLLRSRRPAVLPLHGGARLLGVLAADDDREGVELEARLRALRRVAARAAQALERRRLRGRSDCLTERLEVLEARLDAAVARREALIDALPAAFFETDLSGTLTRASPELARLTGTVEDGLQGVQLGDLAAVGAEETLAELMARVLRSGRSARGAGWALRLRGGGVLPVEISLGVLRDEAGGARGYFGLVVPRGA